MRRFPSVAAALLLAVQPACSDLVEPAGAQDADLQRIEALLQQVISRLDTLEARQTRYNSEIVSSLDTLVVVVQQPGDPGTIGVQLEATVCFERSRKLTAEGKTWIELNGRGMGNVGVDAYGNGAQAFVLGMAGQVIEGKPAAEWDFKGTICAKGYGDRDLGSLRDIVGGIVESVSASQLASVASAVDMSGSRMSTSLNAVPSLSMSQFSFGSGMGADLIASLPLPADLAALLADPGVLLGRATEAAQYAIDRLCDQSLFTGDFAQRAADACALRDELTPAQVIGIIRGLDGLPTTISQIGTDLSSVCDGFNAIRTRRLVIPSYSVDFPLGIGTVEVFPGYNQLLFPNQGAVC
jgi:hypothetical protein